MPTFRVPSHQLRAAFTLPWFADQDSLSEGTDMVGPVARDVWTFTERRRQQRFHGTDACPQGQSPPSGDARPNSQYCGSCSEIWLLTLRHFNTDITATERPRDRTCKPLSDKRWYRTVQNAYQDALRTWEHTTLGLLARPERTFLGAQYVKDRVPDPVTREILLQAHWSLRAENRPDGQALPSARLADMLEQIHTDLTVAGYPDITEEAPLSRKARRMLGHLRDGGHDLCRLQRNEAQVEVELNTAIGALLNGNQRAQNLVLTQIDKLVSRNLAMQVHTPSGGDHNASASHPIVNARDPAPLGRVNLRAVLHAIIREVTASVEDGETLLDALRIPLRREYGWDDGGALADNLLEHYGDQLTGMLKPDAPASAERRDDNT